MDRRKLRLAVVHAALLLVLSALLPSAALGQHLHIRNYTAADGLLGSPVWDITQDSRGFLWIATTWVSIVSTE